MSEYANALARGMQSLTSFVVGRQTLAETLDRVARLARDSLPGADVAGLTLLKDGRPTTSVFTDSTSPEIDQAQYEADAGPCIDALKRGEVLRVDSTDADPRFPAFSAAAVAHGIHSTLSMPLLVDGEAVGALNLYARSEAAFDGAQEEVAGAFATQAAVAIANAQAYWDATEVGAQLHEAMKSRATIEQAKGMLMAAQGCTADDAFDLLVRASQRSNRKLRDIAEELVENARKRRSPPRPPAEAGPVSPGPPGADPGAG